jgi:hypothetical protein
MIDGIQFTGQVAEKGPSAALRSIRSPGHAAACPYNASARGTSRLRGGFSRAPCIWTFLSNLSKWFFSILLEAPGSAAIKFR